MKNSKKGILALIILLAIGFAVVTANLVINGTTLFSANTDEFDVIFTKAIIDGVENNSVISDDGKSITYTTKELAIKDEESILDFTVKNNSTQYDAEVSIECVGGSNTGTYYEIEENVAASIPAQTGDVGKVVVRMIKSSTEPIEEMFTCTITAEAVERETGADIIPEVCEPATTCNEEENVCWIDSDCSGDKTIGDVVSLGTEENSVEQFYIVTSDDENTQMMSMYNLYVGGDTESVDGSWVHTPYENPTGIQDPSMHGRLTSEAIRTGVTVFSNDTQKGTNYSDYSGSVIEGYVNNYSSYISNTLGIENIATLITIEELGSIAGTKFNRGDFLTDFSVPEFLHSTSYWTRSAGDETYVWRVHSDGGVDYSGATYVRDYGVRPVVIISTSLI